MNSKNISIENLKSDYILKKLFGMIQKDKSLEIIRFNKKLKKKLNINIDDYKQCCKIEIELKLSYYKYGQFINIPDKEKEYCHIYFDNSNQEKFRNYIGPYDKYSMIKIIFDYQVESFEKLFYNCNCIDSIFFKKFYSNNITNMNRMFYGCSSLKELNISNFRTKNVTDMSEMFYGCSSLTILNLSKFNINNVTNMKSMFYKCSSLKVLNLSNFNINKVTDMSCMFYKCSSLKELNLNNLNTNKVYDMSNMFR